jgi:hypothetical protein
VIDAIPEDFDNFAFTQFFRGCQMNPQKSFVFLINILQGLAGRTQWFDAPL